MRQWGKINGFSPFSHGGGVGRGNEKMLIDFSPLFHGMGWEGAMGKTIIDFSPLSSPMRISHDGGLGQWRKFIELFPLSPSMAGQ